MTHFQQAMAGRGRVVEATVKWFNTTKGFGFVKPADGSPDAFLHMGAMEAAGLPAPGEGAVISCEIGAGKKGPQVFRVMSVSGGATRPASYGAAQPAPRSERPSVAGAIEVGCTVRWYCPVRGYGFLIADDGAADIFVNAAVLRDADIRQLDKDQRVVGAVVTTPKGREARAIRLS